MRSRWRPTCPSSGCDARSPESGIHTLVTLVEHALARAEALRAPAL